MEKILAVIEKAEVKKISDLFTRKPPGLRFNETDALVVTFKAEDGDRNRSIFFFTLKPDGTFEEEALGADAARARRHRLAAFLRYYGIAQDVSSYNISAGADGLKGLSIEAIPVKGELAIYIPKGDLR